MTTFAIPFKPGITQKVTLAGASLAIPNPISNGVHVVRVIGSTAMNIAFGVNPTATADDMLIGAGFTQGEYFVVSPGWKVAAIAPSGDLYVTEMTR